MEVDYAILIKLYGAPSDRPDTRYSPPECIGTRTGVFSGSPDPQHISTSYVERQDLNLRMGVRHFTRLTNALSKKFENHCHMLAIYHAYYNFFARASDLARDTCDGNRANGSRLGFGGISGIIGGEDDRGGCMNKPALAISLSIAALSLFSSPQSIPSSSPTRSGHCSVEKGDGGLEPYPYPDSLKGTGIEGTVLIEAIIDKKGCSHDVRVVRKLHPELDELAKQQVNSWKFSPATKDGKPITTVVQIQVRFKDPSK